ncbi:MAG TPA: hypothetical protein VKY85_27110 [Candidatus Angelobacter sp.]|nr:hypothetical protein [Candidatus Angelobacter sp.]
MRFEWDLEKELINIKKHGIDFRLASKVFDDPNFGLIASTMRLANSAGTRLEWPPSMKKQRCS